MATWAKEELRKIAKADDLHIAPFRDDGVTYGTPSWIWSISLDGSLYVRAYNGTGSNWYQAALRQKAGRIIAAGVTKEVPSRRRRERSTSASMTPTAPSTAGVLTST